MSSRKNPFLAVQLFTILVPFLLAAASAAQTVSAIAGDKVHHWVGKDRDPKNGDCIGTNPQEGYNETNNQIGLTDVSFGKTSVGGGEFLNSCGDRTGIVYVKRTNFVASTFNRRGDTIFDVKGGLFAGGMYGYKPQDQVGVQIGSRLASPAFGLEVEANYHLNRRIAFGLATVATSDFITKPMLKVSYTFGSRDTIPAVAATRRVWVGW